MSSYTIALKTNSEIFNDYVVRRKRFHTNATADRVNIAGSIVSGASWAPLVMLLDVTGITAVAVIATTFSAGVIGMPLLGNKVNQAKLKKMAGQKLKMKKSIL